MSAPLVLSSADLRRLADGLDAISAVKREHGVELGYTPEITVSSAVGSAHDPTLSVEWRLVGDVEQYVIADRYGS